MWIVRLALRRPYTFVVLAILLLILGPLAIVRTPTDIFPNIDIPVISIIWTYTGLAPQEMSDRSNFGCLAVWIGPGLGRSSSRLGASFSILPFASAIYRIRAIRNRDHVLLRRHDARYIRGFALIACPGLLF